ncbi:MAG: arginine--tRNA ligase [Chitinivibrionales bacterium]|nr:arginine--tRNA ligase [Chitinivibrionales bacterium]
MTIREYLVEQLTGAAKSVFNLETLGTDDIIIEKPKNKAYGDLSTPLAMGLAKSLRKPPPVIAKELMQAFAWDETFVQPDPELKNTIAGGFINFRLSAKYLCVVLEQVVKEPQTYGRDQIKNPKKILLEFVSANPTGPLVVVNARAAAIGDVVGRTHEWIGNTIEREYYVNDYGNQVDLLGKSVASRYYEKEGKEYPLPEEGYHGDYIYELADEIAEENPGIESMDEESREALFRAEALKKNVTAQQNVLKDYGVEYTRWFFESELHRQNIPHETFEMLREKGLVFEDENAVWFKSTTFGDEKDRVIIRSDGTPTYFLADLAYHLYKASRGFDESYTFWGPDHHGYLPRLEGAVKALDTGKTVFKNFIIQQVNLIREGQPFRMSKRKGDYITITDLVNEVGVDAARYFFVNRRLSSHFDFDMDLALKRSEENPVFYVQYAHARTCSLCSHAEEREFSHEDILSADLSLLEEEEELEVIRVISEFPHLLYSLATAIEPHRLTAYCESVATAFHQFYQKHRIVTDNRELSKARLFLTLGVRNMMRLGLSLLGVSAPERM